MKNVIRYSGIAAISFSLILLSLGSIPQSYAGTVGSTMQLELTCGIAVAGTVDWGTGVLLGAVLDTTAPPGGATVTATITNNGIGQASVSAHTGDDTNGGGYAGTTDGITHILNDDIEINIGEGLTPMVNGGPTFTPIGVVAEGATEDIDMKVTVNGVNLPTNDNNWATTITFQQDDCELV